MHSPAQQGSFAVDSRIFQMRTGDAPPNFPLFVHIVIHRLPAMPSYREMDAVGRARARFVSMAKQCVALPINEWEAKFLDGLIRGNAMMGAPPQRLSVRQMEVLFEIRDAYELHATLHGGFSIPLLIQQVYEARPISMKPTKRGSRDSETAPSTSYAVAMPTDCGAARSEIERYMEDT
jgi:hypothetical protein